MNLNEINDKVIAVNDIVMLIGEVVNLRKSGRNFIGLCPFHSEKTPSFLVSYDKNIYKCFGCGKAGNAITFMIDYHGLSYKEAILELARRGGIPESEIQFSKEKKEVISNKDLLFNALEYSTEYFQKALNSNAGKYAYNYLLQRNFSQDVIKEFRLGYSYDGWDNLLIELKRKEIPETIILGAGLAIKNENGKIYDRFRNRLMFPIQNYMGKVIGFGARILIDDKDQAKYLNSPQTEVYDKSQSLYGIFQAKNSIRNEKSAIIVEGYADVISLHQFGFKNTIASSGTSLTKQQLEILRKFCNRIYLVYDGDSAGINATERAIELAVENDFEILIVQLPNNEDPDSYIKNFGVNAFKSQLLNAITFVDFKVQNAKKNNFITTPKQKSDFIIETLRIINKISNKLEQNYHIQKLSQLLDISEPQLRSVYFEKKKLELNLDNKPVQIDENRNLISNENNFNSNIYFDRILLEEELILKLLIIDSIAQKIVFEQYNISDDKLLTEEAKDLFAIIKEFYFSGSKNIIFSIISDEDIDTTIKDYLSEIVLNTEEISEKWTDYCPTVKPADTKKVIQDAYIKIEINKINQNIEEYKNLINNLQINEQLAILKELKELNLKKSKLINKLKRIQ